MDAKCLLSLVVVVGLGMHATQGQDARVKLCGREFIRMVVTSCGSSRLKRSTPDLGQHRTILDWLNSDQFANMKTSETEVVRDVATPRDHQDTTGGLNGDQLTHLGFPSMPQQLQGDVESSTIPLVYTVPSRTRRDAGPAGVCCRSGCTLSELVQYC
ncbi:insulin-like 3 (Leydig cell) [Esox lucius]|uniref:Insulin-like 3 n=1 Tax=Esox lucius TaxID=8010 RepID=A0AAY5L6L7_ESOLU|nr:insulin-like 3 (Leydig cell) [Esox lucius]